jgi:hypothetical protein
MNFVFPFFGKTIGSWWVLISLAGWILHLIQKRSLIDFIFFFYSVLILIYPYTDGGLRFIFPMLPFLIYYLCFFFAYLFYKFQFGSIILNTLLILLISAYFSPLKQIIASSGLIEKGPYEKQSVELFNFLKTTSKSSVIVFCKARAISLYSERSSLYPAKDQIESKTLIQFKRHENLFVVISKDKNNEEIFDPLIIQYIHDHRDNYVLAWENEFFIVMKQVKNFKSGLASQEVL